MVFHDGGCKQRSFCTNLQIHSRGILVACKKCKKRVYYVIRKDPGLFLLNYRVICQLSKSCCGRDGYLIVLYSGFIIKHIWVFSDEHGITRSTSSLSFARILHEGLGITQSDSPFCYHSQSWDLRSHSQLIVTGASVKITFLVPKTRIL